MGMTYATLQLSNFVTRQSLAVEALVDTGATFLCVTEVIARQLGFDISSGDEQVVLLGDGRLQRVPRIAPIRISIGDRSYITEAVVLGDEPLLGVIPLEAMDLVVDPARQRLMPNPKHPHYPVALVK